MKRILFLLCLALACALIACGDDSPSQPKQDDTSSDISSSSEKMEKSSSSSKKASNSTQEQGENTSSETETAKSSSSSEEEIDEGSGEESDETESAKSSSSSKEKEPSSSTKTFPANYDAKAKSLTDDRDGEVYKTVQINDQIWMAENFRYLPEGPAEGCEELCLKEDEDSAAVAKYGRHYAWIDVMRLSCDSIWNADPTGKPTIKQPHQGICPNGWHVPSIDDWKTLVEHVNILDLISKEWVAQEYTGTDRYGFNVLPRQLDEAIVGYVVSETNSSKGIVAYFDDQNYLVSFMINQSSMSNSRYYLRCIMD